MVPVHRPHAGLRASQGQFVTLIFVALVGCGPSGSIRGQVVVEGGSSASVPVAVYGATSQVVLSQEDGTFIARGVADGPYLARALIRGAEVEEVSVPVAVSGGKATSEPTLTFKMKTPGKISGRVTAEHGDPARVTVFVYGPQSAIALTEADGRFSTPELPDGTYVLRASMKGALSQDASAEVKLSKGTQNREPVLAFQFPEVATVTGRVAFSDGSKGAGLAVTLLGPSWAAARTDEIGVFTFQAVPAGTAVITVEAPQTKEGRLATAVAVSGAMVDVGELRFTPVARITGVVSTAATPMNGATVSVAGTGLSAITGTSGRFEFENAPVGEVTFVARTEAPPRMATATVRLSKGLNPDVMLSMTEGASQSGAVAGAVTFAGPQSPRIITVSIPVLGLTAQPGINGAFSFPKVPVGEWELVATAPLHPRKRLGRVVVEDRETARLPAAVLSFFEPLWEATAAITNLSVLAVSAPWALVAVTESSASRTLLLNVETKAVRVLASTPVASARFSTNAKYVAFTLLGQVTTYELSTGQFRTWSGEPVMGPLGFSTDETTLFISHGTWLERISMGSGMRARFPSGNTGSVVPHTNDRWFVRDGSDVTLVEPTSSVPSILTEVRAFAVVPTPHALTDCTRTPPVLCTLRVIAPAGRVANAVDGTWPPSTTVAPGSADFPIVSSGPNLVAVRASDGTSFPFPQGTTAFVVNSTGTRVAHVSGGALREEALPPRPSTNPVAQTNADFELRYLTPTRLLALDAAIPQRVIDVRNGTATVDADVSSPLIINGALAIAPTPSTGKWKAYLGDRAATIDLGVRDVMTPITPAARSTLPVPEVGAVSFDASSSVVIDGRSGTVRNIQGARITGAAERFGMNEAMFAQRGNQLTVFVASSVDQFVEIQESRLLQTQTAFPSLGFVLNIDETRRMVVVGSLRD